MLYVVSLCLYSVPYVHLFMSCNIMSPPLDEERAQIDFIHFLYFIMNIIMSLRQRISPRPGLCPRLQNNKLAPTAHDVRLMWHKRSMPAARPCPRLQINVLLPRHKMHYHPIINDTSQSLPIITVHYYNIFATMYDTHGPDALATL